MKSARKVAEVMEGISEAKGNSRDTRLFLFTGCFCGSSDSGASSTRKTGVGRGIVVSKVSTGAIKETSPVKRGYAFIERDSVDVVGSSSL